MRGILIASFVLVAAMFVTSCDSGGGSGPDLCRTLASNSCNKLAICFAEEGVTQAKIEECKDVVYADLKEQGFGNEDCGPSAEQVLSLTCEEIATGLGPPGFSIPAAIALQNFVSVEE